MNARTATVVIALFTCTAYAQPSMFPLPKGAAKPSHVVIAPGVSEQDYFWLNEAYPSSSALDHYARVFAKWRPCHQREMGWSGFGDVSGGRDEYVHQRMRHWVNAADDVAITLALRYTSQGATFHRAPDNDEQYVALIRMKQPNASATFAKMGVTCP